LAYRKRQTFRRTSFLKIAVVKFWGSHGIPWRRLCLCARRKTRINRRWYLGTDENLDVGRWKTLPIRKGERCGAAFSSQHKSPSTDWLRQSTAPSATFLTVEPTSRWKARLEFPTHLFLLSEAYRYAHAIWYSGKHRKSASRLSRG